VTASTFTIENLQDIQGFGIAGFNKDRQEAIFLRVASPAGGLQFLAWLIPQVANAFEVGTFDRLFSEISARTGEEPSLKATWTAVMISAAGFQALDIPITDLPAGHSASAFGPGMAARASQIGDVLEGDAPQNWLLPFQPGANQVHLAVLVASDDDFDFDRQVVAVSNMAAATGCEIVFQERGGTLPPPLTGHEHFGFKDGISQPVITGYGPQPQPDEPPAVAPGEFVLGYPDESGTTVGTGTNWSDGSFVVFRRLTQHVAAFRALAVSGAPTANPLLSPAEMGAKMVGRWPSGAPIELNPGADPGSTDPSDWNAFEYATNDASGEICPVWAHIRKANPRAESTPGGAADNPTLHRMMRRGIPFGPPLPIDATADDGVPRGLHFFSVVADLVQQFEFVQSNWINSANFPIGVVPPTPGPYAPTPGTPAGGPDPVVGEYPPGSQCLLQQNSGTVPVPLGAELVNVTAGEYFSLPSLAALASIRVAPRHEVREGTRVHRGCAANAAHLYVVRKVEGTERAQCNWWGGPLKFRLQRPLSALRIRSSVGCRRRLRRIVGRWWRLAHPCIRSTMRSDRRGGGRTGCLRSLDALVAWLDDDCGHVLQQLHE
jgi:Dyp-type peroxidase family